MRRRNGPHLIRFQKGDDGPRHLNKNSTYMAIHLHSLERELFVTLAFRLRCSLARAEGTAAEEASARLPGLLQAASRADWGSALRVAGPAALLIKRNPPAYS